MPAPQTGRASSYAPALTEHRLIRATRSDLLKIATLAHQCPSGEVVRSLDVPRWRNWDAPDAERAACWRTRWPDGSVVAWCLEVEQGANGVLAHLSAAPAAGPLRKVPPPLRRLALRAWAGRELAQLARVAEPQYS
jgi:hypothetical protein